MNIFKKLSIASVFVLLTSNAFASFSPEVVAYGANLKCRLNGKEITSRDFYGTPYNSTGNTYGMFSYQNVVVVENRYGKKTFKVSVAFDLEDSVDPSVYILSETGKEKTAYSEGKRASLTRENTTINCDVKPLRKILTKRELYSLEARADRTELFYAD